MDETSILTAQKVEPTTDNIEKFLNIVADAFDKTPHTIAFSSEASSQSNQPLTMFDARKDHFRSSLASSALSNSVIFEAGNWSAVALWKLPIHDPGNASPVSVDGRPLRTEWRLAVHKMKCKHLSAPTPNSKPVANRDESSLLPHYELFLLARNPSTPPIKGAIAAVVRPFLARIEAESLPAWLEATYEPAVSIYEHFGFRIAEEVTIGKNRVDRLGWPTNDGSGEGIKAWGMIYDKHLI